MPNKMLLSICQGQIQSFQGQIPPIPDDDGRSQAIYKGVNIDYRTTRVITSNAFNGQSHPENDYENIYIW